MAHGGWSDPATVVALLLPPLALCLAPPPASGHPQHAQQGPQHAQQGPLHAQQGTQQAQHWPQRAQQAGGLPLLLPPAAPAWLLGEGGGGGGSGGAAWLRGRQALALLAQLLDSGAALPLLCALCQGSAARWVRGQAVQQHVSLHGSMAEKAKQCGICSPN